MDQETMLKVAELEQQYRGLQENLQLVENQILELEQFKESLNYFMNSNDKEALSPLGKGVYVKSILDNKKELFVGVGAGIVVKKTPRDVLEVVKEQILRLKGASLQISTQFQDCEMQLKIILD